MSAREVWFLSVFLFLLKKKTKKKKKQTFQLPLNVYLDQLRSFHVVIVDSQLEQSVEYEKHLFSLFQVIDVDYRHQMVVHPRRDEFHKRCRPLMKSLYIPREERRE